MADEQDRLRALRALDAAQEPVENPNAFTDLQTSLKGTKEQIQAKNEEIATIALEKAIQSGDLTAIRNAATELGKTQGLTGSELRSFSYNTTRDAAKGEKPIAPAADANFTYDYAWRQDVGGPGGKWVLTKTPNLKQVSGLTGFTGFSNTGNTGNTGNIQQPTIYTAPDGKVFTDLNAYNSYIAQTAADAKRKAGQSAYDLLFGQFSQYGLGALVEPLKAFIQEGLSEAEFTLRLRDTDAYKKRFAANATRINQGLRALSEAEYIRLEDQYQDVMQRYGLPKSYYTRGDMGRQEGFEKFIGGDVSATELEDRIQTAYNRVINAAPEVAQTLRTFYPEISDGDILAYALDPSKAIENIKRKVTAAEIGGAATAAGFATGLSRAEELQRYGVTGAAAREGYQSIGTFLPRASTLGDIYAKQGMGAFTQATAEAEVFGTPGSAEATQKRRKLAELEQAQFGGSAGTATGALARERAGQF